MTGGTGNAAWIAVIAIVPLVVLMLTSFVKISVVLSLLRNAIGAPDAPSGLVVMGLSLILTFFVMMPVAIDMAHAAAVPAPTAPAPAAAPPMRGAPTPASPAPALPALAPAPSAAAPAPALRAPAPSALPAPALPAPSAAAPAPALPAPASPAAAPSALPAPSATSPAQASPAAAPSASPAPSAAAPSSAAATGPAAPAPTGGVIRPLDLDGAIRELVPAQYQPQLDAASRALVPLRGFLARHAAARDRETFTALATRMGRAVQGDEVWVLAPAFVTTELREAFAIAVLIFVPFLVIDLVVGLGLAALGLTSSSPQSIALPLKLLLFVSVDGWRLLLDGLVRGYL